MPDYEKEIDGDQRNYWAETSTFLVYEGSLFVGCLQVAPKNAGQPLPVEMGFKKSHSNDINIVNHPGEETTFTFESSFNNETGHTTCSSNSSGRENFLMHTAANHDTLFINKGLQASKGGKTYPLG